VNQEQVIEVDAYAARDLSFALLPQPAAPVRPLPQMPAARSRHPAVSLASLVALGAGATLLASAIVTQAASSQPGLSRPTAFLSGSALGVSAVGGVMLYFDLAPGSSKGAPRNHEKDFVAVDR
jgi:hypothetical protein